MGVAAFLCLSAVEKSKGDILHISILFGLCLSYSKLALRWERKKATALSFERWERWSGKEAKPWGDI
jgi:hypothetical protein